LLLVVVVPARLRWPDGSVLPSVMVLPERVKDWLTARAVEMVGG
jgi:hypothetical protein